MGGGTAAVAEPELPPIPDAELAVLALAADPDEPVGADAVCLWDLAGWDQGTLLPAWYMPAPMGGRSSGWQRWVIALIVASFLVINAYGLCSTYGSITFG